MNNKLVLNSHQVTTVFFLYLLKSSRTNSKSNRVYLVMTVLGIVTKWYNLYNVMERKFMRRISNLSLCLYELK